MGKSFYTGKDSELQLGSANFAAKILLAPLSYGLSVAQATAYGALNTTFQGAWVLANNPDTRTKGTIAAKDDSAEQVRIMASNLAKIIDGTPTVTNTQKIDLGLSVRSTPTPVGAPSTPYKLVANLRPDGSIEFTWKCDNPAGCNGVIYQVYRKIDSTGAYEYIGGTGERKFTDMSVPQAVPSVMYQIQATRSTAVGVAAEFTVNFGVNSGGVVTATVANATKPAKIAA